MGWSDGQLGLVSRSNQRIAEHEGKAICAGMPFPACFFNSGTMAKDPPTHATLGHGLGTWAVKRHYY